MVGAPHARRKGREGWFHVVERTKPDGTLDWYTYHFTKRGADKAVSHYIATGEVKGFIP
jgi:hypothetical protein